MNDCHSWQGATPMLLAGLGLSLFSGQVAAVEEVRWSGYVSAEYRAYPDVGLYAGQDKKEYASVSAQPELYLRWESGDSLAFVPYGRSGDPDDERNHADIRELLWLHPADEWELRLGIGKVFWGVTESLHLVDIINQTDLVENLDGEDKLGQPMVNLSLLREWGTVELFVLPGFRERTFPGTKGRLRSGLVVDSDRPLYESDQKDNHVDWAARWSRYVGDWDLGLSHFSGTGREPELVFQGGSLRPYYPLIEQTGITVQSILGSWLWKLEAISRKQSQIRYEAAVGGVEYTYVGLGGSAMDLGLIVEYLYDERKESAPTPFEDDLMVGLRWVFNDSSSSEILLGGIFDRDSDARSINIEASRRLGDAWKLQFEARGFKGLGPTEPLYPYRNDSYYQLELARYF